MSVKLDYYFSMISPWAFIGHDPFMDIVAKHRVAVAYRPMSLPQVFEGTGGVTLAKRHPSRTAYRLLELQRWREKRGLDFPLEPEFWPFDFNLADRIVIAINEAGEDPARFLRAGFHASWCEARNMADEATLTDVLNAEGYDSTAIINAAKTEAIGDAYADNTKTAIGQGFFGSPVYVLNGEIFWGQDRLDLLDDALHSGRAPYRVPDAS
ncbi:MAG: 2-hydroxychromene-2-carboxylate isomerase [Fimbriimonadaceae bacterium]|nr:2-hydroxychromene-2-carboxylate isomerase [Alphaproteobacteria bacterium]